ncbi:MAG: recombinase family protein [Chlorobium sp.]|nr:recombinase family protein [Chlorobium sp.]
MGLKMKCYSYIRFSSPEQAKGNSYDRQVEFAKKYAIKRGWKLDEQLSMFDKGLSGFHQKHTEKGYLGVFLEAVKAGKIETPSALLVENLDRLSRATILNALNQFLDLINAGITIVTLMDEQEYSKESLSRDMSPLMISITIMARAHEESLVKQIRRQKSWEINRQKARNGMIIQARCPSWLKLSIDKKEFIVLDDRVKIIKRIYDLYISGLGATSICKILNKEKIKTFSLKNSKNATWGTTYVNKLLTTRNVLGEVQFMKTIENVDGKRVSVTDGEPIPNYYPQVIDDEIYLKAQDIKNNRTTPYGKIGEANNIFTGISKCGYCGSSMNYAIRSRKKHKYLACCKANVGHCKAEFISFRYEDFEDAFLEQCTKINLPSILTSEKNELERKIANIKIHMLGINDKLERSIFKANKLEEAMTSPEDTDKDVINYFLPKIREEIKLQNKYSTEVEELKQNLTILENAEGNTKVSLESVKDAIAKIKSASGEDRIEIRKKLQFHIRGLVDRIDFYPAGKQYLLHRELLNDTDLPDDIREFIMRQTGTNPKTGKFPRVDNIARKQRTAIVRFKGGGVLQFANNPDTNELEYAIETKDGEGFKLTERSRYYMDRLFKRSAIKDNELLEKELMDRLSRIESNDKGISK